MKKGNIKIGYLTFVIPGLLLLLVFHTYPLLNGIYYSMTDWNGINRNSNFIGLDNYQRILSDERVRNSLFFTLKYTVVSTVLANILALSVALALVQKVKLQNFFRGLYFLPAVLSLLIIGYIWNQIFFRVVPIIGEALNIPILQQNILGNADLAFWGLVTVTVWQSTAILIVIYLAGLKIIPEDVYEAGRIDGAEGWKEFFYITMPLIVPSIAICLVLSVKNNLMVYDYIVALTNGGPGFSTESITLLIYNLGFLNNRFAYGTAASIVLFLIILMIALIQVYFLRKKEVQM